MATGVTARDLMRTKVETPSAEDTVETALARFEEARIGAPVVADGRLVGMLTLTDIARTEHLAEGKDETHGEYALSEPDGEELESNVDPGEVFYLKEDNSPERLRFKAREVIQSGRLPNRHPDQTWGGPGHGACCTVCGERIRPNEVELELDFAVAEGGPGLVGYIVHPRCFAALEHERQSLDGGEQLST